MSKVLSESGEILYTQTATATCECPMAFLRFARTARVPLSTSEFKERGRIVLPTEVDCLFHPGQHTAVILPR